MVHTRPFRSIAAALVALFTSLGLISGAIAQSGTAVVRLTRVSYLEPEDSAAILTFHDQIEIVQDFTDDKDLLLKAIDEVAPEGNMTAFNQAALQAINLAATFPEDLTAVVMMTNSADNVGSRSTEEVIGQAQAVTTPIYVIGFDKVMAETTEKISRETGGRSFVLSDMNQMTSSAQAIGESLKRGGYKVTFQSGLQADGKEHDLVVRAAYQAAQGQTQGRFTAIPGKVTVRLPDLTEAQAVSGMVNLAVQATAPARIASIAYWLDEKPMGQVTAPPYRMEWDTTDLEPGTYHLRVKVTDRAGNQGQTEINLNVVRPIVVAVSTPQAAVEVGTQIPIGVKIEAIEELSTVEFLVDGRLIRTSETSPYRFVLDSSTYSPGKHIITIRAEDRLGRQAETDLTLQFVAPAPIPTPPRPSLIQRLGFASPRQLWTRVGLIGASLGLLAINSIGLLFSLRAQQRRQQKGYRLDLCNLGNIANRYACRAEDPMGVLRFQFTLNGANLPQHSVGGNQTEQKYPVEREMQGVPPDSSLPPSGAPVGHGARQTIERSMGASSAAANALSGLGQILPGSAGTALQQAIRPVYRAQSTISSTKAQAESSVGQITRLAPGAAKRLPTSSPARGQNRPGAPAIEVKRNLVDQTWVETPFVQPGEILPLELLVAPLHPHRTQRYTFKVMSKAIEPPDSPWVREEGTIQIAGISWLRQLLPYVMFVVITVAIVLGAIYFWAHLAT